MTTHRLAERLTTLGGVGFDQVRLLERFRVFLEIENGLQNLTRLISPDDFYEGHFLDCFELNKLGWVTEPAMDLGSGCGVPGIVMRILKPQKWILTESEGRKADFLVRAAAHLSLEDIQVYPGRAESFLKMNSVSTVVVRAVANLSKIGELLNACSTWNTMVLMKGPAWEDEWNEFQRSRNKKTMRVLKKHEYTVGAEQKKRILVLLERCST